MASLDIIQCRDSGSDIIIIIIIARLVEEAGKIFFGWKKRLMMERLSMRPWRGRISTAIIPNLGQSDYDEQFPVRQQNHVLDEWF